MVNVVKAPEKRCAVIGEMPVVEGQVHEQKTGGQLKPRGKVKKVEKTKRPVNRPVKSHWAVGVDQSNCREEGEDRNGTFTRRRPIIERAPCRRGKRRSRTNKSAKSATATSVVAKAFKSPV
jgi:hypothetical protein